MGPDMDLEGFEPSTFRMRTERSPTEPQAREYTALYPTVTGLVKKGPEKFALASILTHNHQALRD